MKNVFSTFTVSHCMKIYSRVECGNFGLSQSMQKANSIDRLVSEALHASRILLFLVGCALSVKLAMETAVKNAQIK